MTLLWPALVLAQTLPPVAAPAASSKVTYSGKEAIRLLAPAGENLLAPLADIEFADGVIEIEVAGRPGSAASETARGFVGIAFRTQADGRYECIYLRPTNGRADDQVRRNHSVQYVSEPAFPWPRMRKEFPEKYESYVDLVPGVWTKYRIEVRGTQARLFVHGNEQPTLIVSDLKLGATKGGVALWAGPGTEAHFANFRIAR